MYNFPRCNRTIYNLKVILMKWREKIKCHHNGPKNIGIYLDRPLLRHLHWLLFQFQIFQTSHLKAAAELQEREAFCFVSMRHWQRSITFTDGAGGKDLGISLIWKNPKYLITVHMKIHEVCSAEILYCNIHVGTILKNGFQKFLKFNIKYMKKSLSGKYILKQLPMASKISLWNSKTCLWKIHYEL